MVTGNRFQHNGNHIQDDQYNNEDIDDLIPMFIPYNFRMKQSVYFLLVTLYMKSLVLV